MSADARGPATTATDIDALIGAGRSAEAEAILGRALAGKPHDPNILIHLARLAADRRDFRRARELAARALSQAPANAAAAMALADALNNLGYRREALIHFRKVLALRPDIALCRLGMGICLVHLGRPDEAKAEFARFFAQAPELAPTWCEVAAVAFAHTGDLKSAIGCYAPALSVPKIRYQHDACVYASELMERADALPAEGGALASLVVWGDAYIDDWLGFALPSLLQPSNLPNFAKRCPLRMRVFTDQAGQARLRKEPAMARLGHFAKIEYDVMPDWLLDPDIRLDKSLKYLAFALMHHVALHEATARRADLLIFFPDMIIGDGGYRFVADLADAGTHDVLLTQGLVSEASALKGALRSRVKNHVLDAPPRDLMDLAFRHTHLATAGKLLREDRNAAPQEPGILAFAAPDGARFRMLQALPMWISHRVLTPDKRFKHSTPDDQLADRLFPDPAQWARIRLVGSTDEFAMVGVEDFDPAAPGAESVPDVPTAIARAARAYRFLDPFRRYVLGHEIRLIGKTPPPWADAPDPAPLIVRVVAAIEKAAAES